VNIRRPELPPKDEWATSWLKMSTSPGSDSIANQGTSSGDTP